MFIRGRRAVTSVLLFIAVLAASGLTCEATNRQVEKWKPEPRVYTAKEAEEWAHIRETAVALQLTQSAIAQIQEERATQAAQQAADAAELAAFHPPVIIDVDFPDKVPVDGSYAKGTIRLKDGGRDVNRVSIETIEGNFASGSWDPTADLTWSGIQASAPFGGQCGRSEFVTSVIKLQDAAGNVSEGYTFSFYCQ